jgi:hypothetical protein
MLGCGADMMGEEMTPATGGINCQPGTRAVVRGHASGAPDGELLGYLGHSPSVDRPEPTAHLVRRLYQPKTAKPCTSRTFSPR